MTRPIFILIAQFLFSLAVAQQPLQFSFTHYNTVSGLLSNQVNSIVQDKDGYLWTGNTDGLQRFDGIRYKSFRHRERDNSLPSNPVWQLLVDKQNNLWVLLANGMVGIFDTRKFVFREIPTHFRKAISPNTYLKRLIQDEYGHVFYLMGGSEVITWDEKSGDFSYKHNFVRQKEDWDIIDFIQQPGTHKYWMSVRNGGLAVYNNGTGQLSYSGNNTEKESLIKKFGGQESYNRLFFDLCQRFWCIGPGNNPVIYSYNLKTGSPVFEKPLYADAGSANREIQSFFQQKDGTVWIYGLLVFAKFQENGLQFHLVNNGYENEKSISYEYIHCLYEDRENNIWVCTDNNGLYRFNPAAEFFTNVKHTSPLSGKKGETSPASFIGTNWGTTLVATYGDGIFNYDRNFNLVPTNINGLEFRNGVHLQGMAASRDSNTIWLGTDGGVYMLDQRKRAARLIRFPALGNSPVHQVAEDNQGNLWLGTQTMGVFKWKTGQGKNVRGNDLAPVAEVPPVTINKILIDSKGFIWIGTPENGLYLIDPVSGKLRMHFTDKSVDPSRLPENGISSILEYDDSTMIITTATRVVKFNRNTRESMVIGSPGLISGYIAAVERDKNGWIWLTSTNGLYRININKRIFLIFNRTDGIDNDHFIQASSYSLPDGRMLFGSTNHFIAFNPDRFQMNSALPDIRITDFKVMNKSLSVDSLLQLKEIVLGYQDNSLVIEFSPLMYNSPYLIKFKLEGLDKDWRVADKTDQAIYSYLPPGNFTFLLKSVDEEKNESQKTTSLNIKVNAPFWRTIWFYGLLILLAAWILYRLDRERMNRKESMQKMRTDIADNLHQEINVALSNINILSEMAKLKAVKEPEKSKEYIEQIHNRSHAMMTAMEDMLWSIDPENDSMAKAVEKISEHIDGLRNKYGVRISFTVDKKVEGLKLDMKLRKNVFWLLKSGSTNMIRSGATDCSIHLWLQKQNLVYTIEFNNAKLDRQLVNNILQRQELAEKLREVNGAIQTQLNISRSVIELTVPLA